MTQKPNVALDRLFEEDISGDCLEEIALHHELNLKNGTTFVVEATNLHYVDNSLLADLQVERYDLQAKKKWGFFGKTVISERVTWKRNVTHVPIFSPCEHEPKGYVTRSRIRAVSPDALLDPLLDRLLGPIEDQAGYINQVVNLDVIPDSNIGQYFPLEKT
jgi:hypothetical protein